MIKEKVSKNPIKDHDVKMALMRACAIAHSLSMIRKSMLNKRHSSSLAHTIERLQRCLVLAQKQKIADVLNKNQSTGLFVKILRKLKVYMFRKKINKQEKLMIKVCKIPVYFRKENKCPFM